MSNRKWGIERGMKKQMQQDFSISLRKPNSINKVIKILNQKNLCSLSDLP